MPKAKPSKSADFVQTLKKLAVSAFVVVTFIGYAIHDRLSGADAVVVRSTASDTNQALQPTSPTTDQSGSSSVAVQNTSLPQPPAANAQPPAQSGYRDGQYTGDVTNAFYGTVQVRATIQSGHIADVQFLDFPQDRRTSQRINYYATPMLRTEAIQAQSAQVDLISGATLTSEAFVESLQTALAQARG